MAVLERVVVKNEEVVWKDQNEMVRSGGMHPREFYGEGPFIVIDLETNPAYDIQYAVVKKKNGELLPPIHIGWFASR